MVSYKENQRLISKEEEREEKIRKGKHRVYVRGSLPLSDLG